MAKGKSSKSAKSESVSRSKRPASASQDGRAPSSESKSANGGQRAITGEEIGNVAGEVWKSLHLNGDQTLAALKKSVDAPPELVLAAIGWLAREGKLTFSTNLRPMKIALR